MLDEVVRRIAQATDVEVYIPQGFKPLWVGTVCYLAIGVACCCGGQGLKLAKKLSPGEAQLCAFFTMVAFISMWMMWAMVSVTCLFLCSFCILRRSELMFLRK